MNATESFLMNLVTELGKERDGLAEDAAVYLQREQPQNANNSVVAGLVLKALGNVANRMRNHVRGPYAG